MLGAVAIAAILLGSGCSSAGRRAPEPAPTTAPISTPIPVAQQQQAARLLGSATSALAAGDAARALQLYSQIDPAALPDDRRPGYFLDRADAAVQEGDLLLARSLLVDPELLAAQPRVRPEDHRRWLGLRGQLFGLLGDTGASVAAYAELTDLLTDPEEKREIERAIWQVLERTPTATLSKLAAEPASARLHGWYQLALASRERVGNAPSATIPPPAPTATSAGTATSGPLPPLRQVALLLPRSGAYSAPANAVRDGFMAAAFAARAGGAATPDIRLYDAAAGDVLELYRRAADDGAELVIGPLNEDDLARLAAQPSLPVPVLGLNELAGGTGAAANFHTLALAVADEAGAAAQRAWQDGRRAALVLVPDAPWGRRALDAFRDTFTRLGGEVRAGTLYDMALKDFVPVLRPLLAAAADTAAPAPSPGAEAPRRRTDIDMVFLVAYPAQGRQIKPSLDFLYAGDLPVYATSAIYAGVADAARDGDLDGIRFSTMPWALAEVTGQAPAPETELPPVYRPFFALGADAYLVHPLLGAAAANPGARIAGHTGTLEVDSGPAIHRIQPWAQFRNGRAYPESTPP